MGGCHITYWLIAMISVMTLGTKWDKKNRNQSRSASLLYTITAVSVGADFVNVIGYASREHEH